MEDKFVTKSVTLFKYSIIILIIVIMIFDLGANGFQISVFH